MAKHDTTSTTDAFDFSIFWTCLIKATTNDCKCLNVNRIRSKNFQEIVSKQQLACRWTCSMNLKLGTIEASLATCEKVIATWLRYEKLIFGTQYPQSHYSPFTLLCELCKCDQRLFTQLQNNFVFGRVALERDRIFEPRSTCANLSTADTKSSRNELRRKLTCSAWFGLAFAIDLHSL